MELTIKQIVDKEACVSGLANFVRHFTDNQEVLEYLDNLDEVDSSEGLS